MTRLQPTSDSAAHAPSVKENPSRKTKPAVANAIGYPAAEFRMIDQPVREARARRRLDAAWENRALHKLAECVSEEPHAVLQGLLALALELCGGGSKSSTAGISMLEVAPDGTEQFKWVALAGKLVDHIGGTTPRNFSPCGFCLDRGGPVVLARPDLKFTYFLDSGIEFTEGLVLPFTTGGDNTPMGTIWVVSHPPVRHLFDSEDVRLMESLGKFAASAYTLARDRDAAEKKRRVYQDGLASVSHDLRTPLHTISGYVEMLSMGVQGPVNSEQSESLGRIKKTEQFLSDVVSDLLDYARLDAGNEQLRMSPVPPDRALRSAFALVEPLMREKHIKFTCESVADSKLVNVDEGKLEQILVNLLGNAAKFTGKNGVVSIGATEDGDRVLIRISDSGKGIPADSLEAIFDPFVQLERIPAGGSRAGVGLGLSISRALAQRMGGDLKATSQLGRGSVFTVALPLA